MLKAGWLACSPSHRLAQVCSSRRAALAPGRSAMKHEQMDGDWASGTAVSHQSSTAAGWEAGVVGLGGWFGRLVVAARRPQWKWPPDGRGGSGRPPAAEGVAARRPRRERLPAGRGGSGRPPVAVGVSSRRPRKEWQPPGEEGAAAPPAASSVPSGSPAPVRGRPPRPTSPSIPSPPPSAPTPQTTHRRGPRQGVGRGRDRPSQTHPSPATPRACPLPAGRPGRRGGSTSRRLWTDTAQRRGR